MAEYINNVIAASILPNRAQNTNKASFGRIVNIAGSENYIGAAYLSSISALKVGAGYVTLACPPSIFNIIAQMAPELTFHKLAVNDAGSISNINDLNFLSSYDVVSIGCGISVNEDTKSFVINVLNSVTSKQKLVIDADALNNISDISEDIILNNSVITPHPKELSRLLKVSVKDINNNREKFAVLASKKYNCVTVLKGHSTIVTDGSEVYINTTGSSALAKAGSGDVLTGIISGFAAQKLSVFQSAILGVFLHGLSGDIAADVLSEYSVLASDVIEYLPSAIKKIFIK